jgi:hypothetical protein
MKKLYIQETTGAAAGAAANAATGAAAGAITPGDGDEAVAAATR